MSANEREQKIKTLLGTLLSSKTGVDMIQATMGENGFSLLRQVEAMTFPAVTDPVRLANAREGIILDTETTGVDAMKDKVIQLAMLKITYDAEGILSIGDTFDRFKDPGMPIPPEVTQLTRITDEDVKGKTIEDSEVKAFIGDAKKVICHNSAFDRKFVEREFPGADFDKVDFDCSFAQIDWLTRGFSGRTLELIALKSGYVYGSHNALNDIMVMPYVLNQEHPGLGTPFAEMHAKGQRASILLVAQSSPFESKDLLKERGYRWSPDGLDAAGNPKSWFTVLEDDPEKLAEEADFLKEKVYHRDVELPAYRIMGDERYSARRPAQRETFRTREVLSAMDVVDQKSAVQEPQAAWGF